MGAGTSGRKGAGSSGRPARARFIVAGLLFVTVVINYLDRANLAVAAPLLRQDLGIDSVQMGLIFSAFGWSYASCQIPGGWLVDRMSSRRLYTCLIALWSVATGILGLARSMTALFGLRLAVGAIESPSFPINNRVVTIWFPERERASAIAFYTSGQFVGLAFLTPVLMYLQLRFGWRALFAVLGLVGIVWAVVWYLLYREPAALSGANSEEVEPVPAERRLESNQPAVATKSQSGDLLKVVTNVKLWGLYIGQYAVTSVLWFFLTWFPTYLVQYRHISFSKAGVLASLPFLAAFCGVVLSGLLSDFLFRRGLSLGASRKAPIVAGLLLSMTIIGANFVQTPAAMIAFMSLAFFGNGVASISWSLVSELAPIGLIGLTGGMFNFMGNLPAITVPIIIGILVRGNDFSMALAFISAMALMGALSYIFVVGKIEHAANHPFIGE